MPDPVPASSPTRTSRDTTAGTVRAAMSATDPGGRSLPSLTVDSVAPGSVSREAPSAVSRPTRPPAAPTRSATNARIPSARRCTRRPNRTSRRLSRAPSPRGPATASSWPGGGGPSVAVLPGLRHGSSSPDHSDGSAGAAPGPAPGGRCNVTPLPAGRPKASASAAGGGAVDVAPTGGAGCAAPENAPDTPSGRPKAATDSASTAGRSSGRGPRRGVPFDGGPFDGAARGTSAAPGRTQGSPSDSLIDNQTAGEAVKSASGQGSGRKAAGMRSRRSRSRASSTAGTTTASADVPSAEVARGGASLD